MPTKTRSKPAARKSPAKGKAAKSAAAAKSASAKARSTKSAKPSPKATKAPAAADTSKTPRSTTVAPTPAARSRAAAAAAAAAASEKPAPPKPKPQVASVSLIDEKAPRAKRPDGAVRTTRSFLPPISKIMPKAEPVAPPKPKPVETPVAKAATAPAVDLISPPKPPPAPASPVVEAAAPSTDEAAAPAAIEGAEDQKIIHIKPPIIVKHLATELGLKPHQLIAELMALQHFREHQPDDRAGCRDQDLREPRLRLRDGAPRKGRGVHKVEEVIEAPPAAGDRDGGRTQDRADRSSLSWATSITARRR